MLAAAASAPCPRNRRSASACERDAAVARSSIGTARRDAPSALEGRFGGGNRNRVCSAVQWPHCVSGHPPATASSGHRRRRRRGSCPAPSVDEMPAVGGAGGGHSVENHGPRPCPRSQRRIRWSVPRVGPGSDEICAGRPCCVPSWARGCGGRIEVQVGVDGGADRRCCAGECVPWRSSRIAQRSLVRPRSHTFRVYTRLSSVTRVASACQWIADGGFTPDVSRPSSGSRGGCARIGRADREGRLRRGTRG